MIWNVGVHRPDHAEIINAITDHWKQIADFGSTFPAWAELPASSLVIPPFALLTIVATVEPFARIKCVHVRNAPGHEQEDHLFRFRAKWVGRGASGLDGPPCSAINSDNRPGNSIPPAASERIVSRRSIVMKLCFRNGPVQLWQVLNQESRTKGIVIA